MAFRRSIYNHKPHLGCTLSRLILEKMDELGEVAIGSFFPAKYPQARLWRSLLGLDAAYEFRRETFSTLLGRLREQRLVQRSGTTRKSLWRLTSLGKEYLSDFERRRAARPDGVGRLVIFDVPEKERRKRSALRLELVAAGFEQLQKSVWYGERPLPEDFVRFIDALALRRHVHIFSVLKTGTLPSARTKTFC